jgi:hypothetical protein
LWIPHCKEGTSQTRSAINALGFRGGWLGIDVGGLGAVGACNLHSERVQDFEGRRNGHQEAVVVGGAGDGDRGSPLRELHVDGARGRELTGQTDAVVGHQKVTDGVVVLGGDDEGLGGGPHDGVPLPVVEEHRHLPAGAAGGHPGVEGGQPHGIVEGNPDAADEDVGLGCASDASHRDGDVAADFAAVGGEGADGDLRVVHHGNRAGRDGHGADSAGRHGGAVVLGLNGQDAGDGIDAQVEDIEHRVEAGAEGVLAGDRVGATRAELGQQGLELGHLVVEVAGDGALRGGVEAAAEIAAGGDHGGAGERVHVDRARRLGVGVEHRDAAGGGGVGDLGEHREGHAAHGDGVVAAGIGGAGLDGAARVGQGDLGQRYRKTGGRDAIDDHRRSPGIATGIVGAGATAATTSAKQTDKKHQYYTKQTSAHDSPLRDKLPTYRTTLDHKPLAQYKSHPPAPSMLHR